MLAQEEGRPGALAHHRYRNMHKELNSNQLESNHQQQEQKERQYQQRQQQQSQDPIEGTSRPPPHSRHASSKYDFVKVRVWLGENADHYYVLSRFLVSRMLTVTKIPNHVAIKISLELKKLLIDNSLLDVSQSDLEANIFKLMERRGYGEEYINRYKMMTRFHHQRVPLVILVCGTACVGKSTVATQLAQRLNLPNVLQTDMVYELIRTSTDAPLASIPIWERDFPSSEVLLTEFARECRIVRKGLNGDLKKAMKDGKPIIIEGIHLDPRIYLVDEQGGDVALKPEPPAFDSLPAAPVGAALETDLEHFNEIYLAHKESRNHSRKGARSSADSQCILASEGSYHTGSAECNAIDTQNKSYELTSIPSEEGTESESTMAEGCANKVDASSDAHAENSGLKAPAKAIVVPIVLRMDEFDHKTLLEEWIGCKSFSGAPTDEGEKEASVSKLMTIQDYLCSFKSQGITVMNISATTFQQTIDALHSYLLQRIEDVVKSGIQET